MKWFITYLVGFMILMGALYAALSMTGVIHRIGPKWTAVGLVAAFGIGLMWAVSAANSRGSININK